MYCNRSWFLKSHQLFFLGGSRRNTVVDLSSPHLPRLVHCEILQTIKAENNNHMSCLEPSKPLESQISKTHLISHISSYSAYPYISDISPILWHDFLTKSSPVSCQHQRDVFLAFQFCTPFSFIAKIRRIGYKYGMHESYKIVHCNFAGDLKTLLYVGVHLLKDFFWDHLSPFRRTLRWIHAACPSCLQKAQSCWMFMHIVTAVAQLNTS